MSDWKEQKNWSDRFLREIRMHLGDFLLSEPPEQEDCERNSDLMVLRLRSIRIGCRIRKFDFFEKYPNDITVRSSIPGGKTELAKMIEGWGDYFFYGFANESETRLQAWRIIDLKPFRLYLAQHMSRNGGSLPGSERKNRDGGSAFRAFNVKHFEHAVVAEWGFKKEAQPDFFAAITQEQAA
jgi:hypothetical protein